MSEAILIICLGAYMYAVGFFQGRAFGKSGEQLAELNRRIAEERAASGEVER